MHHPQLAGMQGLALEATQRLDQLGSRALGQTQTLAVQGITQQRIADVGHVHADLVGTPGFQLDPDMGVATETFQYAVMGDRRLAGMGHCLFGTDGRMTADGLIHLASTGHDATGNGFVLAKGGLFLQLIHQRRVRLQGLGDDQQPGGVLVDAMDDTGAGQRGQIRAVVQQRIEQRAVRIAGTGMHHQPHRLVDHQQMVVLVDDIQFDGLGRPAFIGHQLGP